MGWKHRREGGGEWIGHKGGMKKRKIACWMGGYPWCIRFDAVCEWERREKTHGTSGSRRLGRGSVVVKKKSSKGQRMGGSQKEQMYSNEEAS